METIAHCEKLTCSEQLHVLMFHFSWFSQSKILFRVSHHVSIKHTTFVCLCILGHFQAQRRCWPSSVRLRVTSSLFLLLLTLWLKLITEYYPTLRGRHSSTSRLLPTVHFFLWSPFVPAEPQGTSFDPRRFSRSRFCFKVPPVLKSHSENEAAFRLHEGRQ